MQAQFTTKSNRIIKFDVEVSKRQDGLTGPPATLIVRNLAGRRREWTVYLRLMGVSENRAYYRVVKAVTPENEKGYVWPGATIRNKEAFLKSMAGYEKYEAMLIPLCVPNVQ